MPDGCLVQVIKYMQDNDTDPLDEADWLVAHARAVHEDLGSALRRSIRTLSEQSETLVDAIKREQMVRFHTSTLLQLIEIEVDLEGRVGGRGNDAASELDFDAARAEVLSRLSRGNEPDTDR